jgi:hypothetical protein
MPRAPTIVFGVLMALAAAAPARATITLTPGNNPQPNEANVLFNHGDTSSPAPLGTVSPPPMGVVGTTNTAPPVSVTLSSTQNLYVQGGGQGLIIATATLGDPATQVGFTNFALGLPTGRAAQDVIFDAHLTQGQGQPGTGGTATITVFESNGTSTTFTNRPIGNGENFYTLVASGGEDIQRVTFAMASGQSFTQLQQIRVSGIAGVTVIPEPSTMVMAGTGLVSWAGYRVRKRRKAAP